MSLYCKLVPVYYREYEYGQFKRRLSIGVVCSILVLKGHAPTGQPNRRVQHRKSGIHRLPVKPENSNWLGTRNEHSAQTRKIGSVFSDHDDSCLPNNFFFLIFFFINFIGLISNIYINGKSNVEMKRRKVGLREREKCPMRGATPQKS